MPDVPILHGYVSLLIYTLIIRKMRMSRAHVHAHTHTVRPTKNEGGERKGKDGPCSEHFINAVCQPMGNLGAGEPL